MFNKSSKFFAGSTVLAAVSSSLAMSSSASAESAVEQTELSSVPSKCRTREQVEKKINEAAFSGFTEEMKKIVGKENYEDGIEGLCYMSEDELNSGLDLLHEEFLEAGSPEALIERMEEKQVEQGNMESRSVSGLDIFMYILIQAIQLYHILRFVTLCGMLSKDEKTKEFLSSLYKKAKEKAVEAYMLTKTKATEAYGWVEKKAVETQKAISDLSNRYLYNNQ